MGEWVRVSADEFAASETRNIRGVAVEVFVSPFDLPDRVRGEYDPQNRQFVVEFGYIDAPERDTRRRKEDHITVVQGRNTGRIQKILLDVDAMNAEKVQIQIRAAAKVIEKLGREQPLRATNPHLASTQRVLSELGPRILEHAGGG